MSKIIEVTNLTKNYKQPVGKSQRFIDKFMLRREYTIRCAIDHIGFSVEEGEMVGYLGLNGAGKSTTVKILTGILAPSKGTVRVLGLDPLRERKKCAKQTAALFGQKNQLWWDLPVWDSIELVKYLYAIPASVFHENYAYIDKYLNISEIKKIPVRQLSLGQRMRANLCFALLHDPKIVFLDEPTIGLDILTKQQVHDCIKEMNHNKGVTMILTTHDVSDIENLCKRVLLIDQGKIVFDNSLDHLKNDFVTNEGILIKLCEGTDLENVERMLLDFSIEFEKKDRNEYLLHVSRDVFWGSRLFFCLNENFAISSIMPANESLSVVLTKVYESIGKSAT